MFLSSAPQRILAYSEPVDMRKSFNGLVALVQNVLLEDPLSGCLFVFFNRRGNYMKLVTWDRTCGSQKPRPPCRFIHLGSAKYTLAPTPI